MVIGCGGGAAPVSSQSSAPTSAAVPAPAAPAPVEPAPAGPAVAGPAADVEGFETATVGSLPAGWAVAGTVKDIAFAAARGNTGNVLQIVTTGDGGGTIKRALEVARYRGKRVAVSVRGSCQPVRRARAVVGVDIARSGARGYGDRARTQRIELPAWREYRTVFDVAADATGLDLVVAASGASTIQIDDITVSVLGDAGIGDEPPRALDGRALENVAAFARLYGVVRYFHPSDGAAALDDAAWQRFVVRGVREVESAADAAALEVRLEKLFAPIAPSVAIYPQGQEAPAAAAVSPPAVHWSHSGVGISPDSLYRSTRGAGARRLVTTITTQIDPARVRGKELAVTLRARAQLSGDQPDVGLWIAEQRPGEQRGFYTEPEMQPAVGTTWTEVPVKGRISAEATQLSLGIQVIGDTEAWLEAPVVTVDGKPLAIPAWGKPDAGLAAGWRRSGDGVELAIGRAGCDAGRPCLHVRPRPPAVLDLWPWSGALGGGLAAWVPIELATRDGKTVPAATASPPASGDMALLATDRATRLAAVIIAWNVFQHFYPYFDVVRTDWMPELPRRLGEAARADGTAVLHATLRRMVYELHDGHGSVYHSSEDRSRIAPWLWEQVEGKLVVTQVAEQCACDLAPGDVVTAIDGVPAARAIAAAGALTSSGTEQFRTHVVLRDLRSGPEGGRMTIAVERKGAAHEVAVALVEGSTLPFEKRPASGEEIAPGIRYVNLDRVTEQEWKQILPELAAARGVVADMRGYPNKLSLTIPLAHVTRKPIRSAQWHVPMPARPDREGMTFTKSDWEVQPAEPFLGNVVFLTDGRAVSAAETFMGIVEAYKLGPIVGGPTAGTNGNINPFAVPGDYLLWWTGMKVLKHDGSRHHGVGILPTVPAQRTVAGVAAGRDEVLEKGIAVAQQRGKAATKPARPARGPVPAKGPAAKGPAAGATQTAP
jgi:C-terminal processing protease CtpA/Prc